MIIPGATLLRRGLVQSLISASSQCQPCGIDLSLKRVLRWTSPGAIDFDNSRRLSASTQALAFTELTPGSGSDALAVHLAPGGYLAEFNETVKIPLDAMGQLFVRSSLWRSGVTLSAGVVDSGYEGPMGGLLDVRNPHGVKLFQNAKLGQIVFHMLPEEVVGYSGVYQKSTGVEGKAGAGRAVGGEKL